MDLERKAATAAVVTGTVMALAVVAAAAVMAAAAGVTTRLAVDVAAEWRRLPLSRGGHPPLLLLLRRLFLLRLLQLLLVPLLPFARVNWARLRLRVHRHRKAVGGCQTVVRAAAVNSWR